MRPCVSQVGQDPQLLLDIKEGGHSCHSRCYSDARPLMAINYDLALGLNYQAAELSEKKQIRPTVFMRLSYGLLGCKRVDQNVPAYPACVARCLSPNTVVSVLAWPSGETAAGAPEAPQWEY